MKKMGKIFISVILCAIYIFVVIALCWLGVTNTIIMVALIGTPIGLASVGIIIFLIKKFSKDKKQKAMLYILGVIFPVVCYAFVLGFPYSEKSVVAFAKEDIAKTDLCSREDVEGAMDSVKEYIHDNYSFCWLIKLEFEEDDYTKTEEGVEYIEIHSYFKVGIRSQNNFQMIYMRNWRFSVRRESPDGEWTTKGGGWG